MCALVSEILGSLGGVEGSLSIGYGPDSVRSYW
jgi:hypothetical protein